VKLSTQHNKILQNLRRDLLKMSKIPDWNIIPRR